MHLTISLELKCLQLLPLMYFFELNNIILFIKILHHPTEHFNIKNYFTFSDLNTRSSTTLKLKHAFAKSLSNSSRQFYFFQLPRLWNSLSPVSPLNLHLPQSDPPLISFFGPTLTHTLILPITALITANAHAQNVYHHSVLPTSLLK